MANQPRKRKYPTHWGCVGYNREGSERTIEKCKRKKKKKNMGGK